MNGFDIIAIVIFLVFVVVCAIRGFLKILSKWGAFFAAMILSKIFGGMIGEKLLGDALGGFAPIVGTIIMFVILLIVLRILLGIIAKTITKTLHLTTLDRILGAIIGAVGGLASVYLFALVLDLIVAVVSIFNADAEIVQNVQSTAILKYFMS